jgi:hypothetical protein
MSYNTYPWYHQQPELTHYHSNHRNQTIQWSGSDQPDLYEKNLKDPVKRAMLERFNWLDPIEYKFNNHGFRAEAFDDRPAGLALGCSFTEGIGLHLEQTWPSILSNQLDTHLWNLGSAGAALDTVFRFLDHYLTKFKPKFVCVLTPPYDRMEYCTINDRYQIILTMDHHSGPHTSFAKEWLTQSRNGMENQRKNTLAIRQLCADADIPVYIQDSMIGYEIGPTEYSRDLLHYGADVQRLIAENFYKQIRENCAG